MGTTNVIKLLVIIEAILIGLYMLLSITLESDLPLVLVDYLNAIDYAELSLISKISWWISGSAFFVYITAVVFLLLTKPIGKWLYLIMVSMSLISAPAFGHVIEHTYLSAIGQTSTLIQGAVLSLLFLTKSEFNKHGLGTRYLAPAE